MKSLHKENGIGYTRINPGIVILLLLTFFSFAYVSSVTANSSDDNNITISLQYMTPTEEDRDIRTTNIDLHFYLADVEQLNLLINWGFIATYATGNITQLEGSLAEGNLTEVQHENSAFGIGPGILLDFRLGGTDKWSFHLQGLGNFIVYNKRFPAGGDYYNFMWRGGPSFKYKIDSSKAVDIGYHWAHISNGQGESAKNPSYEAKGFILRFVGFF